MSLSLCHGMKKDKNGCKNTDKENVLNPLESDTD